MNSTPPLRFRQEGSDPVGIHFSGSRRRALRGTACALLEHDRLSSAPYPCRFPPETPVAEPLRSNLFGMIDLQKSIKTNNFNSLQKYRLTKNRGVGVVMVNQLSSPNEPAGTRLLSSVFCPLRSASYLLLSPFPLATISPCLRPIPLRIANFSPPPPIPARVSTASSPPNAPNSAAPASRN